MISNFVRRWGAPVASAPFVLSVILFVERIFAQNPDAYEIVKRLVAFQEAPNNLGAVIYSMLDTAPSYLVIPLLGYTIGVIFQSSDIFLRRINTVFEKFNKSVFEGIIRFRADAVRLLRYHDRDGILYNETANDSAKKPRNVLLNNKTLQDILYGLKGESEIVLEDTGKKCGRGFSSVIILGDVSKDDMWALFDEWFRYDSNAGFGRFEVENRPGKIRIRLRHNFLCAGTGYRSPDKSLCAFMRGYILGVLESFPEPVLAKEGINKNSITIEHDVRSLDCICTSQNDDKGCVFEVTSR